MNTNGNTYTVIYSAVLVILVAAILAFVAMIRDYNKTSQCSLKG